MNDAQSNLSGYYLRADRLMLGIIWFVTVLILSLASWYDTWLEALVIGLPTALVPTVVAVLSPGSRIMRITVGCAFMVQSALMIHQGHGMIELHFGIFALLALLLYYRDWAPLLAAAGLIAVHHLSFNYLQAGGTGVWVFPEAGFRLVLIHAAYVVFETAVLVYMATQLGREAVQNADIQQIGGYLVVRDGRINLAFDNRNLHSEFAREFSTYISTLGNIVGRARTGALSIHGAAREIAAGNNNLSERTEQQAASLEQTASSMDQMTSTVRQNAENARQANQLADTARTQAERGSQVVSGAVEAMSEINASSRKIADIIGVVDEIAFQTNLLALNAAVEAARAGEMGRGFAVVATEVRNLAQRSAESAKQIKNLIDDSVGKVQAGSKLVDESGETLEEIMQSIKKVADIVSEIAVASQEQSEGIEQVNRAVTQMDQMTQQNSALVEQAAAAAESMEESSAELNELMGVFDVEDADTDVRVGTVSRDRQTPLLASY